MFTSFSEKPFWKFNDLQNYQDCACSCYDPIYLIYHLAVYFVTRRYEKQIKSERQVSPQAAADFAKEKKALKTPRMIVIAYSMYVWFALVNVNRLPCRYTHSIFCVIPSVIINCYSKKTFRELCKELLNLKLTLTRNKTKKHYGVWYQ